MVETETCPECGAERSTGAPCAACLMKLGLPSDDRERDNSQEAGETSRRATATPVRGFTAPTPAALQEHFPQLEILALCGQGGMGAVYKARQRSLDRLVALKIINPEAASDPTFASRFAREARALAKLSHPNIVGVHDFGEVDGLYYLVMEFVDGVDVRTLISNGKLQPAEALALVPQICDALQYAHEEHIVHRDIKPENILVDKRGRVKIADFGLAKMLRLSAVDATLTHTRHVVGTFHYMAPEQFERPDEVDHRADIYALGVVFYEMLTGMLPVGRFDLPSQRHVGDAKLDEVVLKALEREPDRRYQQASEVKSAVESLKMPPQAVAKRGPTPSAQGEPLDLEEVRGTLAMPAIGLMVYGGLALAAAIVIFAIFSIFGFTVLRPKYMEMDNILWILACAAGGGVLGGLVLATGLKMRHLESYDLAVAGALITLLTSPTPFTFVLALPLGIWSLVLLRRPQVRRAFALQQKLWRDDPVYSVRLAAMQKIAGLGWGLVAVGAIELVGPIFLLLALGPTWLDDLWYLLLSILPGILMIIGGLATARLGSYTLAMIGGVAALIPCSVLWPVSATLGVALVLTLRKPQIKSAFGLDDVAEPAEEESFDPVTRWEVWEPAAHRASSLLFATAALHVLFAMLPWAYYAFVIMQGSTVLFPLILALGTGVIGLVSLLIWAGAVRMRRGDSWGWALVGSIAALLPVTPAVLLGLPAGIYSLWLLSHKEAAHWFATPPEKMLYEASEKF